MSKWFRVLTGGKTMTAVLVTIGLGLLDLYGVVDIRPLVEYVIPDEKLVGAIMTILGLVFGVMRFKTKTELPWMNTSELLFKPKLGLDEGE